MLLKAGDGLAGVGGFGSSFVHAGILA